jgi:hypothetical protein
MTKIPKEILQKLKLAGANVKLIDTSLYSITDINIGDEAWYVYKNWIESNESNDYVKIGAGFFPTCEIKNSERCPSLDLAYQIQTEASSLIYYMKDNIDFPNFNIIEGCKMIENIPQKNIIKLYKIIQNPPSNYSILYNLKSKSYICTLNNQWDNAGILINLFKN